MHIHTTDQEEMKLGIGNYTCNWGTHIAGLYETEEERDAIVFGFLSQGDKEGDLQLYCPSERTESNFREKYSQSCPCCSENLDDQKKYQLSSTKELYYPDGTFSPWAMEKGLNEFFSKSQRDGKCNIRATAEMVWALEAIPGVEHLMAYESRLNYFIPGKPWISICLYNVTKFSGAVIMDVLRTHPFTISGGVITKNPFFQNPDDYLKEHAPEFLPGREPNE